MVTRAVSSTVRGIVRPARRQAGPGLYHPIRRTVSGPNGHRQQRRQQEQYRDHRRQQEDQ
jgi:hypothetical protein